MGGGQFLDPTRGGMEPQLQRVERESAVHRDDEFAVQDEARRAQAGEGGGYIWEVARERLARFGLQVNVVALAKCQAAKPIPFRLVLPLVADRNFIYRFRFHRRQ